MAWPDWLRIAAQQTLAPEPDTDRHKFDDGWTRQAKVLTSPRLRVAVTATFAAGREADFRDWVAVGAANSMHFRCGDGVLREMTVVGGAGGIAWRQRSQRAGPPAWEADMTLVGPA